MKPQDLTHTCVMNHGLPNEDLVSHVEECSLSIVKYIFFSPNFF
jgi:hypothetical protein